MRIFLFLQILISVSCASKIAYRDLPVYNDSINQQFWTAEWSPCNKFIAVGGVDSTVRIFHAENLRLYKTFFIPSWIHIIKWHPDGNLLAIATSTEYVQLLDISSGKITLLKNDSGPHHDGNGSRAMDWNHDGKMLAVGGLDGVIKLWDKYGNLLRYADKYKPRTSFVSYLALDWHPSKNIFTACNFEIQLYDSACKELKVMEHANKEAIMLCVKWHPSGDFFVIGDYGYNWEGKNVPSLLHFWSGDGRLRTSVTGSKKEYRNIDWNPSGSRLATASDVLRIWTRDGKLLHEGAADRTNYLWGLSWNKDGTRIVTSSRYKTVSLWDSAGKLVRRVDLGN